MISLLKNVLVRVKGLGSKKEGHENKKKKVSFIALLVLVLTLTTVPVSSLAATSTESVLTTHKNSIVEPQATTSKTIQFSTYFNNLELPPFYYYYNQGGWKGTLSRISYMFYETTGVTLAVYEGKVTCTGTCINSGEEDY